MGAEVIQLVELAEQDRKLIASLPVIDEWDEISLHVRGSNGEAQIVNLPPRVARIIRALLGSLSRGKRTVLLTKSSKLMRHSDLTQD